MRRNRPFARRGIATLFALALVGIAGAAVTLLLASLSADYRRTRQAGADAQVRELLVVGAASLTERAGRWDAAPGEEQWQVPLPPELQRASEAGAAASVAVNH